MGSVEDQRDGNLSGPMASNMSRYEDIRWQQRYEHFDRALALLREALPAIRR